MGTWRQSTSHDVCYVSPNAYKDQKGQNHKDVDCGSGGAYVSGGASGYGTTSWRTATQNGTEQESSSV